MNVLRRFLIWWHMDAPVLRIPSSRPPGRLVVWIYPWPGDWKVGLLAVDEFGGRTREFLVGPLVLQVRTARRRPRPEIAWYWPR